MKGSDSITIRAANRDDARTVHQLVCRLAAELTVPLHLESRAEDFERFGFEATSRFEALLAIDGDQAIGLCIHYPIFSSWRGRPGVFVLDLYVDAGYRGRGVGRRLLSEACGLGRSRGATFLHLNVHRNNTAGRAFYRRLGLAPLRDEEVFQADILKSKMLSPDR